MASLARESEASVSLVDAMSGAASTTACSARSTTGPDVAEPPSHDGRTTGDPDAATLDPATAAAMVESGQTTAVVYRRVSTKEQGQKGGEADGFSLPSQSDAGRRKAQALNATVVGEFTDKATGTTLNRPGLRQLLAFVG